MYTTLRYGTCFSPADREHLLPNKTLTPISHLVCVKKTQILFVQHGDTDGPGLWRKLLHGLGVELRYSAALIVAMNRSLAILEWLLRPRARRRRPKRL